MASWFITRASAGSGFADHLANLLGLATASTSQAAGTPAGFTVGLAGTVTTAFIAIVLGIIAFLATVIQIMLMLVRGGMLVLLVGTLPLVAAFSNTEMGLQWFRKASAWLIAFALYKPAAAVVYAVAFDLAGQQGALALLDGVMMLVLAILALPALLRFVVPATSALAGAGGAGAILPARRAGRSRCGCRPAPRRSLATPASAYGQAQNGSGPSGAALAGAWRPGGPAGSDRAAVRGQAGRREREAAASRAAPAPGGRGLGWRRPGGRDQLRRPAGQPARAQAVAAARRRDRWFRRTGRQAGGPGGGGVRATRTAATGRRRPARPGSPAEEEGRRWRQRAQVERTYGNWRRPRPPGLWHLGLISSVLLIVGSDRGDRRDRARSGWSPAWCCWR